MPLRPDPNRYLDELKSHDPDAFAEVESGLTASEAVFESAAGPPEISFETIVLTTGRPVLDVKDNVAVLDIQEVESQVWKSRLENAASRLAGHVPAVGRIELVNHPRGVDWIGTGWVIRDDIIVTNRHVAEVFAHSREGRFVFRTGLDGHPMAAHIDFLEEFGSDGSFECPAFEILHLEPDAGPDVAFLRIRPAGGHPLPAAVDSDPDAVRESDQVVVIGYPARDPFFPNPELMDRIFRHRYDRKRIAPGLVTGFGTQRLFHDCTTLGGNSGGEIVSLRSGKAVALHFAGTLFARNHAVPIDVVNQLLDDVLKGQRRRPAVSGGREQPSASQSRPIDTPSNRRDAPMKSIDVSVPIRVKVSIGEITVSERTTIVSAGTLAASPTAEASQDIQDEDSN